MVACSWLHLVTDRVVGGALPGIVLWLVASDVLLGFL